MESDKKRRWKKKVLIGLLTAVVIWFLGDFIYSRVMAYRISRWEATIERDADGVIVGCGAYSAGEGQTAILFLHGINDTPFVYRKMVPEFVAAGYHCRVMRLPGFGETTERYAASTKEQWLAELETEIKQLRQDHQTIFLVAHSLGGAIALKYLQEDQSQIAGLILLAPVIEVSNHRSPLLSARAWHEIGHRTLLFTQITETPYLADAVDPDLREFPQRIRFIGRSTPHESFELIDENRGCASRIKLPLLVVIGMHDHVIDNGAVERFYNEADSNNKHFLRLENSGHAMQVDYDWRQLTGQILAFIQDVKSIP